MKTKQFDNLEKSEKVKNKKKVKIDEDLVKKQLSFFLNNLEECKFY